MLTNMLLNIALLSTEWVIWGLLVLSVLSVAVIVERFLVISSRRGDPDALETKVRVALRKGGSGAEAAEILKKTPASAARVISRVRDEVKNGGLPFEEALSIALSEEKLDLERRVSVLGTLGSNAPYIGLLGTVLGIIHAFHNLSQHVQGGPSVILKGISEALVATALGLFVAIPAVAAYNYFVRSIRKILVNAENTTRALAPVIGE